jgi:Tc5 transposase DNA-binding domain
MNLNQEGRILLATQAIKLNQFKSIRAAAISYDLVPRTLERRIHGMTSRCDSIPNSRKLTPIEELAVVQYILDLDSRGLPPRPQAVQEMADLLLAERDASLVSKNWTSNFINRCTELKTKFSRKYDYKRALCKDPVIIGDWFKLVQNIVAKYRILEEDIYNFDKAGFMIGVIAIAKVIISIESRNRLKTT